MIEHLRQQKKINLRIFFPNDLLESLYFLSSDEQKFFYLLGFESQNDYFIVTIIKKNIFKSFEDLPNNLKNMKIIGTISLNGKRPLRNFFFFQNNFDYCFTQESDFFFSQDNDYFSKNQLTMSYHNPYLATNKHEFLQISHKIDLDISQFIIMYDPPILKNLEYFSVNPILLESLFNDSTFFDNIVLINKFNRINLFCDKEKLQCEYKSIETILDILNQISNFRLNFRDWLESKNIVYSSKFKFKLKFLRTLKFYVLTFIVYIIMILQFFIIKILDILNYKIGNFKIVNLSYTLHQLDLRLSQFNYFPIQFLCYYDKNILYNENSMIIEDLDLPIQNFNLNINNSNYINMFNSIWLIFNDIFLGILFYKINNDSFNSMMTYTFNNIIKKYLLTFVIKILNWISLSHPSGLKLNTELCQFMASLMFWILKFLDDLLLKIEKSDFFLQKKNVLYLYSKYFLKILCCYGGLSFFFCFIIDLIKFTSFHIFCLYYACARIYNKQLNTLKSLFQLFRGKKYNVLRNRIDNLNNFTDSNEKVEIDRLLLGTLLFIIIILLLPTVFVFYMIFFVYRLINFLITNTFINVVTIFNFTPLFMFVLKLKNSKRLQGGLKFDLLSFYSNKVNYIKLSNQSLPFLKIFENFIFFHKLSKKFKNSLIPFFFTGRIIDISQDYSHRFRYIMLPQNYHQTINVWKYLNYPHRKTE